MPYYVFAWIASLSSGCILVISKLTSKKSIQNPWYFNFLWTLITVIFTIPLGYINHAGIPIEWFSIVFAALFSVLWYGAFILSMFKLDVSTIAPMFNFRTIFAVILGMIFLQENFSTMQLGLFAIVIIAGMFATIDEDFNIKSFFTPAIGIILTAMLFLAINNAIIKIAVAHNGLWTTNVWIGIISIVFVSLTYPLFKKDIKKISKDQILPLMSIGALQTITNFALAASLAVNVSITSLIMSVPVSMILAVILSIIFPQLLEHHSGKVYAVRFIATAVMIIAALQLS